MSSHHDGGGTLHLPSPTHCHHIDAASAFVQIRRSLSKSPSRRSHSPKLGSPLSPSPSSPNLRGHLVAHSPLAIPYPPSAKKARSGIRKPSPIRSSLYHTSTPGRKALADCTAQGNTVPSPPHILNLDQENSGILITERAPGHGAAASQMYKPTTTLADPTTHLHNQFFGRKDRQELLSETPARSSPLKRSDRGTNLDLSQSGSPSAKRRSLHGTSFGPDFDIFDPDRPRN